MSEGRMFQRESSTWDYPNTPSASLNKRQPRGQHGWGKVSGLTGDWRGHPYLCKTVGFSGIFSDNLYKHLGYFWCFYFMTLYLTFKNYVFGKTLISRNLGLNGLRVFIHNAKLVSQDSVSSSTRKIWTLSLCPPSLRSIISVSVMSSNGRVHISFPMYRLAHLISLSWA